MMSFDGLPLTLAVCDTSGPAVLGWGLPVGQHPLCRQRRVHPQWRWHGAPCTLMTAVRLPVPNQCRRFSLPGYCSGSVIALQFSFLHMLPSAPQVLAHIALLCSLPPRSCLASCSHS